MIASTLKHLYNEKHVGFDELQQLLDVEDPYPYLSGRSVSYKQYRDLIHHCRSLEARRRLLEVLLTGSGWVARHLDADLDINGDGVIDTGDVLDGALKANHAMADLLLLAREEQAQGMRSMGKARASDMQQAISDEIRHLLATQRVIKFLSEPRARELQPATI